MNEVGWSKGFESADNALVIIDAQDEIVASVSGSKRQVADALWDAVLAVRDGGETSELDRSLRSGTCGRSRPDASGGSSRRAASILRHRRGGRRQTRSFAAYRWRVESAARYDD